MLRQRRGKRDGGRNRSSSARRLTREGTSGNLCIGYENWSVCLSYLGERSRAPWNGHHRTSAISYRKPSHDAEYHHDPTLP
jgi:hypothetical protein